jgi:hypothetical protein
LLLTLSLPVVAQVTVPRVEILRPKTPDGWVRLNSTLHSNTVLTLHASTNLNAWTNIGTLYNALLAYPDAASPGLGHRFYRVAAATRNATNDWKNQIISPTDQKGLTPFRGSHRQATSKLPPSHHQATP